VKLFLPCAAGVELLLADEVHALLPPAALLRRRGGVALAGATLVDAMRLNLESRLAQRVLVQLVESRYRNEDDIYALARRIDWRDWLEPRQTLRVDTTATRSPLKSLNFAALRIKDAVCDAMREATGVRPDVDVQHPDLALVLHLDAEHATLYADSSGEPLFKRGWRDARGAKGDAPLKETLAAAMLAAAGWNGRTEDGPLLDPCCGAGTIAIEAAQIACGIPPGGARRFAFEHLAPWREHRAAWAALQRDAKARVHASEVPIFAGDVSFRMTDFATRNAERAGVGSAIEFKTADALQRMPSAAHGTVIVNPPFGERIDASGHGTAGRGAGGDQSAFFANLATHWKRHYAGWTAWVLSPDPRLPSTMRLKESRRVPLWNGAIECRLFRFDMVAGAARRSRPNADATSIHSVQSPPLAGVAERATPAAAPEAPPAPATPGS